MAVVPNVTNRTYSQASTALGNQCLGINVIATNPPGGVWNSDWVVSWQDEAGGNEVPLGAVVGVILQLPLANPI